MITVLDEQTALVLIDLQQGIVSRQTAHPASEIIAKSAELLAAFRNAGRPVVIVNVNPFNSLVKGMRAEQQTLPTDEAGRQKARAAMEAAHFFDIVPEITQTPEDIRITKPGWNAFNGTTLHEELQQRGVTGIVLAGISTSIGVESTARRANELGYNISFATDAMTDGIAEAHERSLKYIFPRIGELGTVADIISHLQ